jgi:hypothetical protein
VDLRVNAPLIQLAGAILGEIVRVEYLALDLFNQVLLGLQALRLAVETVDQSQPHPHLQFLLLPLSLLQQHAAEPVLRLKKIHVPRRLSLSRGQLRRLQIDPLV